MTLYDSKSCLEDQNNGTNSENQQQIIYRNHISQSPDNMGTIMQMAITDA